MLHSLKTKDQTASCLALNQRGDEPAPSLAATVC